MSGTGLVAGARIGISIHGCQCKVSQYSMGARQSFKREKKLDSATGVVPFFREFDIDS